MISHIVVFIEQLFSDEHRSLDRRKVLCVKSTACEVFVDVVHGGNYLRNIWGTSRKKQCCFLENLEGEYEEDGYTLEKGGLPRERQITALQSSTRLL